MSTTVIPPGMMKMGNRLVPISRPFNSSKLKTKKFLLVIQFYEEDRLAAEDLASLIADLERTRIHGVDVMLMRRADSREISTTVKAKLESKFGAVILHTCRRTDARGYPHASNQMFFDLITLIAYPPYVDDYYAFIPLEPDATPTRPGWIGELIKAWETRPAEKLAIGFIHDNPGTHLNGVAIYAADFQRRVARGQLRGAAPQFAYDVYHSPSILPVSAPTPLIHFSYRKPTITRDELFAPGNDGIVPALYHGVKDGSARALVRARHITFTDIAPVIQTKVRMIEMDDALEVPKQALGVADSIAAEESVPTGQLQESAIETVLNYKPGQVFPQNMGATLSAPTKRTNVYTYYSARGRQSNESMAVIELWRKGWTSQGWNPIVLTLRDAAKHPKFDEFSAAVEKLPCAMDRQRTAHRFNRWLALDLSGGGLLVDCDVLPEDFTPVELGERVTTQVYRENGGRLFGVYFTKDGASEWIGTIIAYDAQPDDKFGTKPDVTDDTILSRQNGIDMTSDGLVHFNSATVGNERKSVAMEKFLAGGVK